MKRKINKSERKEVITSSSLLDSPYEETQVKDKPLRVALRALVVSLLFILLVISYILNFSVNIYPKEFKNIVSSSFDTTSYYKTSACDLVIIQTYKNIEDAQVGDIVFYSTNMEKGTGKIVNVDGDVFELEQTDSKVKRIGSKFVVGKQTKKIAVIGFAVAFLDSYYGILILSLLILAYTGYLTFSRINYENTEQGKKLYKRLKRTRSEEKERKRLLDQIKDNDKLALILSNMLSGTYKENKIKFYEFDYETKGSVKEKYKYILNEVHNTYLPKDELTRHEKRQITSVIELMFDADGLDADMEYMLVDLVQKTQLVDFCTEDFKMNAIDFISSCEHKSYLVNMASVLYVIVYKNRKIREESIKEILEHYNKRIAEFEVSGQKSTINVTESIIKLLNS